MLRLPPKRNQNSSFTRSARRWIKLAAGLFALSQVTGCDVPIDAFEDNRIFAKRLELTDSVELELVRSDVDSILIELFGTPDQPLWPEFLQSNEQTSSLVSIDRLQRAAGAVRSDEEDVHYGLYREHCILCHGIAGNGLGATSRLLNPYPRDFRLGKFKFKSTPIGSRPTRDDLRSLLRHGIAGTSMPSFARLPEDDIEALIDYVIYLTIRGEVERGLLMRATYELDLDAGERLTDSDQPESADVALNQADVKSNTINHHTIELVSAVARKWLMAKAHVLSVPAPPDDLPIYGSEPTTGAARERLAESIAHGRELFQGKVANCASCHGPLGAGDGTVTDYDDWTKDWTTQAGLDPLDKQQLRPMLKLGALKPRHILPRNLQLGVYRGGSRPEDLYTRIALGIDGTPMPAIPMQPTNPLGLTESDVWDLVNFLLSLPEQTDGESNQ
ncbi:MAG: cytochrome c [Pirellulaceae bacterium]|nr:cytochrome c [Pirellulaceae bacterium]